MCAVKDKVKKLKNLKEREKLKEQEERERCTRLSFSPRVEIALPLPFMRSRIQCRAIRGDWA